MRRNLVNCTLPAWMGKQKTASNTYKIQVGKTKKKKKKNTHLILWKTGSSVVISLINHSVVTVFSVQVDDPKGTASKFIMYIYILLNGPFKTFAALSNLFYLSLSYTHPQYLYCSLMFPYLCYSHNISLSAFFTVSNFFLKKFLPCDFKVHSNNVKKNSYY